MVSKILSRKTALTKSTKIASHKQLRLGNQNTKKISLFLMCALYIRMYFVSNTTTILLITMMLRSKFTYFQHSCDAGRLSGQLSLPLGHILKRSRAKQEVRFFTCKVSSSKCTRTIGRRLHGYHRCSKGVN